MPKMDKETDRLSTDKGLGPLNILLVFTDAQKTIEINDGLPPNTRLKVAPLNVLQGVLQSVRFEQPDIIIVECPQLSDDVQEKIEKIRDVKPCPILMFVESASEETTQKAVAIGVNAFCVDGLISGRIKPLIELAFARYEYSAALQRDLLKSKNELEGRKSIERAKGLIMERRKINERDAYDLIRRMSMAKGKSMQNIAETILEFSDFLS